MIPIIISVLVICIIIYIDSRKISKLEDALRGQKNELTQQTQYELDQWRKNEQDKLRKEFEYQRNMQSFQLSQDRERADEEINRQKQILAYLQETIATTNQSLKEKQEAQQLLALQVYNEGLASYNELAEQEIAHIQETIAQMNSEYLQMKLELNDFKARRDAINQEIIRQRELADQEEFYTIQLSQEDIDDINLLNNARNHLHKTTLLDKLIYDMYISKPTNEMIKRVLKGEAPSGIYKITRLKTGEIYIGKSTDIKSRWQQHTKSAFHCGTISHSILHTTMEKDGIDQFTFELLEEVPKDKLTEREKFWIQFYDSTKYGLNERVG